MSSLVERLASDIEQLSVNDQLWLMEKLAQRIRARNCPPLIATEQDFVDMANDPDIQRELRLIEEEFAGTEMDGLDTDP